MKLNTNTKYALYFGGALLVTYLVIKAVQNSDEGDNLPTPEEPTTPQKVGLTPLQTKQEELQSLLGFVGAEVDHVIGPKTIAAYNKLNLGLGITLSANTSLADLQKIIDAIVKKNKSARDSATGTALRQRAGDMVQAWAKNPTSVLSATKPTKLIVVNLDKTTNKYVATNQTYNYSPSDKFTRAQLGVLKQATGFNQPWYVIFKNSNGTTLLANPNDWIIK